MTQGVVDDQLIKDIAEKDIFTLLHAEDLSQEEKDILIKNMQEEIALRTLEHVDKIISLSDKLELSKAMEQGQEKILDFFKSRNINIEQITAQVTIEYKAELFGMVEYMNTAGKVAAAANIQANQNQSNNNQQ